MKKKYFMILIVVILFAISNLYSQEILPQTGETGETGEINADNIPNNIKKQLETASSEKETKDIVETETEEIEKFGYYSHKDNVFSELPTFGNEIFNKSSSGFSATGSISIPFNYILGPGDGIKINIWGSKEKLYKVDVNYEGEIFIPQIGTIYVQAKSLSEVKQIVTDKIHHKYPGTQIYLSVTNPKLLNISVNGEVNSTGQYTLSPLSNIQHAILFADGIRNNGSMRNIALLRNGKIIKEFDLYPYLLTGTKDEVFLLSNDVIFIPIADKKVAIQGNVKRNAIFELKNEEGLKELISFAGGFSANADLKRIQIDRIIEPDMRKIGMPEREIINIDYQDLEKENIDFELQDRDVVTIFPISDLITNYVRIKGAIFKPGTYSLNSAQTIESLIRKSGGIFEDAFLQRCDVLRTYPDGTKEIIDLNLEAIIKGELNFELQKLDEITIHSVWDFTDILSVSIDGAVRKPGDYLFTENMILEDVIINAGGFTYDADSTWVEISRLKELTTATDTLWNVFQVDLRGKKNMEFPLKKLDKIFVRKRPNFKLQETLTIEGEVKYPGRYSLITKNDDLLTLIERAGGLTENAFSKGIMILRPLMKRKFTNQEIKNIISNSYEMEFTQDTTDVSVMEIVEKSGFIKFENINFQRLNVNLDKILQGKQKLKLKSGDIINVPEKTDEVFVLGAVPRSGTYKLKRGMNYKYYVNLAGGYNDNVDKKNISILKYNGLVHTKGLRGIDIENGDYIIIPKELNRPSTLLRDLRDIATITTSILTTAYIIKQISNL